MQQLNKDALCKALSSMLSTPVTDADYTTQPLQGGTVGEVISVHGTAQTADGPQPYRIILKRQKQWERPLDADCWRREYDLYTAGLPEMLAPQLRMPSCYLLEMADDSYDIWMRHIDGTTDEEALGLDALALVAHRLGAFQARCHLRRGWEMDCIRPLPAMRSSFDFWAGRMKTPLSAPMDGFPDDLRLRLLRTIDKAPALLEGLNALPDTLCHGDVHHENIILVQEDGETAVYLIDWDCAGHGRMGEDVIDMLMEAFVYADRPAAPIRAWQARILEAYREGAKTQGVDVPLDARRARDIFVLAWGYRVADLYLYYQEEGPKRKCVEILREMLKDE